MFNDLNAAARESYAAARALALKSDQPVFLVTDTVTLIKGEDLGSLPYSPPLYHELKSISHLPLGVYSASIGLLESPTEQPWIERLRTLLRQVDSAKEDLAKASFTELQSARQQNILSLSRTNLEDIFSAGARPDGGWRHRRIDASVWLPRKSTEFTHKPNTSNSVIWMERKC